MFFFGKLVNPGGRKKKGDQQVDGMFVATTTTLPKNSPKRL